MDSIFYYFCSEVSSIYVKEIQGGKFKAVRLENGNYRMEPLNEIAEYYIRRYHGTNWERPESCVFEDQKKTFQGLEITIEQKEIKEI